MILQRYSSRIKYWWSVFLFFLVIIAVKTYINFITIKNTIQSTNIEIRKTEEKIAFTENFLLNYLDSEYSSYFLAHENNNLFDWEYIIQLKSEQKQEIPEDIPVKSDKLIQTPQESWQKYLKEKFSNI